MREFSFNFIFLEIKFLLNLLALGWWSATVGVDAGVFLLCVFAADEAVAAVIEALMGLGCFLGDPLVSFDTVGPTDCERITKI